MGPICALDDLIDMLQRRGRLICAVIFIGCVLSLLFAVSQRHMYESAEVIQIAQPLIGDDLAPSTAGGLSAPRLQLIEQQLMTRDSVLEIIDTYNLYADMPKLKFSELVYLLRSSVKIEGVAAARAGNSEDGTFSALTVTARMPTPEQARQVAHEFARRVVNLNLDTRIGQARETLEFFAAQEARLAAEVTALEAGIDALRKAKDLTLPGSVEHRRSELAKLNGEILQIDHNRIAMQPEADRAVQTARPPAAKPVRADYGTELRSLEAQRHLLIGRRDELLQPVESTPEAERELGALQRELARLRDQLDLISGRHSEAELRYRMEVERRSEQLTVIEPAALPDSPVSSGRQRIAIIGGGLSVMLALAIAFLLELRHPIIRTAAQMQREVGLQPVVSIPYLDAQPKQLSWWQRMRVRHAARSYEEGPQAAAAE